MLSEAPKDRPININRPGLLPRYRVHRYASYLATSILVGYSPVASRTTVLLLKDIYAQNLLH